MIPALFKLRDILLHPPKNSRMGQSDATFRHHLDEVTEAQFKCDVPSHTQNDDLLVKVPSLEQILCRGRFRHPGSYRRIPSLSTVCTRTIACRVEPADISDRRAAALLLGGLGALFPNIRTVIADAGHQSRKLARHLLQQDGWKLQIVKRRQRAFKITGLTWIVERSFAWLGRNRRLSRDYEYSVQTSETLIDIAATRLILNRLASA